MPQCPIFRSPNSLISGSSNKKSSIFRLSPCRLHSQPATTPLPTTTTTTKEKKKRNGTTYLASALLACPRPMVISSWSVSTALWSGNSRGCSNTLLLLRSSSPGGGVIWRRGLASCCCCCSAKPPPLASMCCQRARKLRAWPCSTSESSCRQSLDGEPSFDSLRTVQFTNKRRDMSDM